MLCSQSKGSKMTYFSGIEKTALTEDYSMKVHQKSRMETLAFIKIKIKMQ